MSNYRVVVIDRRGCRYVAAYYKTFYLASKFFERVVYDRYWKNNTIEVVDAIIEPVEKF